MYQRKTKDIYRLFWNGEEIDSFDTFKEAKVMRVEYESAFHSPGEISIKKGRDRICD